MTKLPSSLMYQEALEIASQTNKLIDKELPLPPIRPRCVYTLGRGSSDHAALVIHHLLGSAGVVSTSMPMSLPTKLRNVPVTS